MTTYIPTVAKAIAAFVTPFLVALLAWLIEQTGVQVPYDPRLIETFLVSVFTAAATWAISNRPTPDTEAVRDRGNATVSTIALIVVVVLAVLFVIDLVKG